MSGGIEKVGLTPHTAPQAGGAQDAHPVTVRSHGQTIVYQPSMSSLVADAQEESGQLLQEKVSSQITAAAHRLMNDVLPLKDVHFVDGSKIMPIVERPGGTSQSASDGRGEVVQHDRHLQAT